MVEVTLLDVEALRTEFRLPQGTVHAVDEVSLSLEEEETLAVVGESGSGKSALALSILRLHPQPPCVYAGGSIFFDGRDLLTLSEQRMRRVRGGQIAMIFQDPMTSLDPVQPVGRQIAEAVRLHRKDLSRREVDRLAVEAIGEVGIANPERRAREYPHQFSGGMLQRAMIAVAVACRPRVLIADEPTTALDVTIQAQILDLLTDLQQRRGTAILLITHDLGVVANIADRVQVMYSGRAVETGPADRIFARPLMPYTLGLLESTPRLDAPEGATLQPVPGQPPHLHSRWASCPFESRCRFAFDECHQVLPELVEREAGHHAACLLDPEQVDRGHANTSSSKPISNG